jgi:hypothetical protein
MISLMCFFEEKAFQLADNVVLMLAADKVCIPLKIRKNASFLGYWLNRMSNNSLSDLIDFPLQVHPGARDFVIFALENIYIKRSKNNLEVLALLECKMKEAVSGLVQTEEAVNSLVMTMNLAQNKFRIDKKKFFLGFEQLAIQIRDSVFTYLERASFQDVQDRATELRRLKSVLMIFLELFKFEDTLSTSASTDSNLRRMLKNGARTVSHLDTSVGTVLTWIDAMQQTDLETLQIQFHKSLEETQDRAAKHAFQMQQTLSVVGPPPSWRDLSSVVHSLVTMSDSRCCCGMWGFLCVGGEWIP